MVLFRKFQSERGGHTVGFVLMISLIALMGVPAVTSTGLRVADLMCDNYYETKWAGRVGGESQGATEGFEYGDVVSGYYQISSDTCCAQISFSETFPGAFTYDFCGEEGVTVGGTQ